MTTIVVSGSMVVNMNEELISLNTKIRKDQHELLRKQAFNRRISMAEMVRIILDDNSYLRAEKGAKC